MVNLATGTGRVVGLLWPAARPCWRSRVDLPVPIGGFTLQKEVGQLEESK